jgi:CDP-diacylglycerol---serine O-phosphatidyltransferase
MEQKPVGHKRRRGIYLLPNLFTTAGLFAGFYAIVAAMGGRYSQAAVAVYVAMVMDSIDGRLARLTNTQSDFGTEYDSLVDMISFGLAPALVLFEWSLSDLGKFGWLAAFVYTAATALRLARFNTQVHVADKRYFQGLASPAAAGVAAGLVWMCDDYGIGGSRIALLVLPLTLMLAALMVSNMRFRSFKDLDLKGRVPFFTILVLVLVITVISINPPQILFTLFFLYAISGPVMTVVYRRQKRSGRRAQDRSGPPP